FRLNTPPAVRITVAALEDEEIVAVADAVASVTGPAPARRYD
ncbi:GntR family transcriptional regulator, partial [Streptomyces sp. SID10115]|nr:GntR family transcriptional regulator [Streptomyces sp. SID10115]